MQATTNKPAVEPVDLLPIVFGTQSPATTKPASLQLIRGGLPCGSPVISCSITAMPSTNPGRNQWINARHGQLASHYADSQQPSMLERRRYLQADSHENVKDLQSL
jgi:hypothetical protein